MSNTRYTANESSAGRVRINGGATSTGDAQSESRRLRAEYLADPKAANAAAINAVFRPEGDPNEQAIAKQMSHVKVNPQDLEKEQAKMRRDALAALAEVNRKALAAK